MKKKPTCVRVSILDARNICFFFRKNDSHFTSISIHINNLRQLRVFTPLARAQLFFINGRPLTSMVYYSNLYQYQ